MPGDQGYYRLAAILSAFPSRKTVRESQSGSGVKGSGVIGNRMGVSMCAMGRSPNPTGHVTPLRAREAVFAEAPYERNSLHFAEFFVEFSQTLY